MPATATPPKEQKKATTSPPDSGRTTDVLLVNPKEIDVKDDFNPRKTFGGAEDKAFTENVKTYGVLQSLLVSKKKDGRFELIAGERRLRAALAAGLDSVPVTVREGGDCSNTFALLENIQRRNLNPIEEAEAMDLILKQTGIAKSRLAEALSVSPSHVTERLRLISLDARTQKAIVDGVLPVSATRFLEKVAKASPDASQWITSILLDEDHDYMRTHPEEYAYELIHELRNLSKEEPAHGLPQLDCVAICGARLTPWAVFVSFPEEQSELLATWTNHSADYRWNFSVPEIDDAAIKAIGAAGQLTDELTVIFDRDTLIHLIDQAVRAWEKQLEEEAAKSSKSAESPSGSSQAGSSKSEKTSGEKATESEFHRREREKQEAYVHNTNLGANLLKKLGTVKPTVALVKALAIAYADENKDMAGLGIGLTDERLQKKDVTKFKNGNTKTKITYPEGYEAHEELIARITRAKSIDEVLGTLFTAIVAATCVDNKALPVAERRSWHSSTFGRYGDELASKELGKLQSKVIPKVDAKSPAAGSKTSGKS